MILQIVLILVLTLINGLFAMSEIAFVSLNDNKIKAKAQDGDKKSQTLFTLLEDSNRFLSTIQIAITLAGFMSSAFASDAFSDVIANWISSQFPNISVTTIKPMSMVAVTLILSYFTLVLGELVPKRIGMKYSEKVSYALVNIIHFISVLTKPIVWLLSVSTNVIVSLLGINPDEHDEEITEEEIRMMIDVSQEKGLIMDTEKKLIDNVFEFDNKPVSDIMTHRTDIIGIDIDSDLDEIKSTIFDERFTRLPVYQESIDNIIGTFHLKDLLKLDSINSLSKQSLNNIIRKPYYVPDSIECDELFFDLQKQKVHMAIVMDEYGGTAGLVTIEDLIEEIVGNIFDEYDEDEFDDIMQVEPNKYLIYGDVSLDAVENTLFDALPLDDYDTLSGFIIGQLGRLPNRNDVKKSVEFNHYKYTILSIENKVVGRVKVEKLEEINHEGDE